MLKSILSILAFVGFLVPAGAVDPNEDLHIKETGQLFVVRLIPGKKQTQIFVAGNKAAEVNFDKLQVKGHYIVNGQERPFKLTRTKDHFVTKESLEGKQIQLEIKEEPAKAETIRLELKKD